MVYYLFWVLDDVKIKNAARKQTKHDAITWILLFLSPFLSFVNK